MPGARRRCTVTTKLMPLRMDDQPSRNAAISAQLTFVTYNVFFQALSGDESALTVAAQLDTPPLGNEHPATTWRPGEILTSTYQLDLTGVAPTVQLQYYFGYYDWRNGARLPVDGGIDDKLVFYGN